MYEALSERSTVYLVISAVLCIAVIIQAIFLIRRKKASRTDE